MGAFDESIGDPIVDHVHVESGAGQDDDAVTNEAGLKPLDALHLSCAVEARAAYLCTCDDRFLKRARAVHSGPPKVVNPLELIREIGA